MAYNRRMISYKKKKPMSPIVRGKSAQFQRTGFVSSYSGGEDTQRRVVKSENYIAGGYRVFHSMGVGGR
jgi:hypothetical protein